MKKIFKKIILGFLIFTYLGILNVNAGIGIGNVDPNNNINDVSISTIDYSSSDIIQNIENTGLKILNLIKFLLSGVLLIYMVYIGVQMILSMGTDEESLSSSKRQLWYTIVGLVFINIPGTIYRAFNSGYNGLQIDGGIGKKWSSNTNSTDNNLFINIADFSNILDGKIINTLEIVIFSIAIFMIILAGIKIMISAGKGEAVKESKDKVVWSLVGLGFIGFIESLKLFIYNGDINNSGITIFTVFINLILFFAGPVAIIFLTLAGYYYITSNGDDEKVKKAKSIIINTVIATIILMAAFTFLADLNTLTI